MTKISICNCGTNHEAFETALKLARQAFKPEADDCTLWTFAVAESFSIIAFNMLITKMRRLNAEQPAHERLPDGQLAEDVRKSCWNQTGMQMVATYQNEELCGDIAKFVCEEMGLGTAENQARLSTGPSEEDVIKAGFGHFIHQEPSVKDDIRNRLAALGFKTVSIDDLMEEPEPGSKPH